MSEQWNGRGAPGTWPDADLIPDDAWPSDADIAAVLEAGPGAFERGLAAERVAVSAAFVLAEIVDEACDVDAGLSTGVAAAMPLSSGARVVSVVPAVSVLAEALAAAVAAVAAAVADLNATGPGVAEAPHDEVAALRAARLAADVPLAAPGVTVGPARSVLAGHLDALEAALNGLAAAGASGSQVDVERTLRLSERLRGLGMREVAEMDALGTHTGSGGIKSSTSSWLGRRLHLSDAAARSAVRAAVDLRDRIPLLGQAVQDGTVTLEGARAVLAGVAGLDAEVVAQTQPALLSLAQHEDPVSVRKRLREIAVAVDERLAANAARRAADRAGVQLHQVGDSYHGSSHHTAENGATISTWFALAVARYRRDGDTRSKAQLQEAALLEAALRELNAHATGDSLATDIHTTRSHLLIGLTPEHLAAASHAGIEDPDGEQLSFADALARHLGQTSSPTGQHGQPDPQPTGPTSHASSGQHDTHDEHDEHDTHDEDDGEAHDGEAHDGDGRECAPHDDADASGASCESPGGDSPDDARPFRPVGRPDRLDPGDPVALPLAPTVLNSGTVLSTAALRRLACDSLVQLVLLRENQDGHSRLDPLHVGRTARTVTAQQFALLVLRDRHCVVKGCRHQSSARATTSGTGSTAAPPTWTTSCCSAVSIITTTTTAGSTCPTATGSAGSPRPAGSGSPTTAGA